MQTLLLDPESWDLVLDIFGNVAVASDPYSQAQDAASAIRLFQGELWYDTTQGVPYWQSILGYLPPLSLLKAKFVAAALTVSGVVSAKCFISSIVDRNVEGQVQITNSDGKVAVTTISPSSIPSVPSGFSPLLNFSDPRNSQYLPGTP